jgi:hypothetical protein
VLNETADYYRFFDATRHAEFLYECVQQTVEHDLPDEVAYLEAYDAFSKQVLQIVDMPNRMVDLLHRFLRQGGGTLSKRARSKEFALLTVQEATAIEEAYSTAFAGVQDRPDELDEPAEEAGGEERSRGGRSKRSASATPGPE